MLQRFKRWLGPEGFEPMLYLALLATGLTGTALALFLGKLFAAAILGTLSLGIFLRFKRGRVRRNDAEQADPSGSPRN
jgi:hypothetical protein